MILILIDVHLTQHSAAAVAYLRLLADFYCNAFQVFLSPNKNCTPIHWLLLANRRHSLQRLVLKLRSICISNSLLPLPSVQCTTCTSVYGILSAFQIECHQLTLAIDNSILFVLKFCEFCIVFNIAQCTSTLTLKRNRTMKRYSIDGIKSRGYLNLSSANINSS